MPIIRVDDEVWRELQKKAEPFVDNPNSVLRRLLVFPSPSLRRCLIVRPTWFRAYAVDHRQSKALEMQEERTSNLQFRQRDGVDVQELAPS